VSSTFRNYPWYALRIRPRFEKFAAKNLRDKGYEEYLPLTRSTRRWSDRMKTIAAPLFPGYLFCKFDIQDRLPILVVPGVLCIVGIGKAPATIPESQISSLQQVTTSGMECEPWPFAQVGQSVSVERGPLAGLKGIVIENKSSLRLVLSLPLLQRAVAVEMDRSSVDFPHQKQRSSSAIDKKSLARQIAETD
jgi:transcription antitermination factor NusG